MIWISHDKIESHMMRLKSFFHFTSETNSIIHTVKNSVIFDNTSLKTLITIFTFPFEVTLLSISRTTSMRCSYVKYIRVMFHEKREY